MPLFGGEKVYISVRAWNWAGLSSTVSSNGVAIANTESFDAVVMDGYSGADREAQSETTLVTAHWDFDDPCPITKYEWAVIGLDGVVVRDFTLLCEVYDQADSSKCVKPQLTTNALYFDGIELIKGKGYATMVRSTNVLGETRVVRSNGFQVDTELPLPGTVYDGPSPFLDLSLQGPIHFLAASWNGFRGVSGAAASQVIEEYWISFGDNRDFEQTRSNVVPLTNVKRQQTARFEGLQLVPRSKQYFARVIGYSPNRASAEAMSNGIFVGYGDPVLPGPVVAESFQGPELDTIAFSFESFKSTLDILFYEVAIGTRVLEPTIWRNDTNFEVLDFRCVCTGETTCPSGEPCIPGLLRPTGELELQDIGGLTYRHMPATTVVDVSGLSFNANKTYYVTVRATDQAYGSVTTQSGPIRFDTTPPVVTRVDLDEGLLSDGGKLTFVPNRNSLLVR